MSEITLEKVKELLSKQLNVGVDKITEDSSIADDLGADSLDTAELAMMINDEFGYNFSDQEITQIKKVRDIVEIIEAKAGV